MKALVVINSAGQDLELGVALDAVMKKNGWAAIDNITGSYTKTFEHSSKEKIIALSKTDVESAVVEAEWTKVPYLVLTSEQAPVTFVAS